MKHVKHGYFVDDEGKVRSTFSPPDGYYCVTEPREGFECVLMCVMGGSEGGRVDFEGVFYETVEEIMDIIRPTPEVLWEKFIAMLQSQNDANRRPKEEAHKVVNFLGGIKGYKQIFMKASRT